MICAVCKQRISDESLYCIHCGSLQDDSSANSILIDQGKRRRRKRKPLSPNPMLPPQVEQSRPSVQTEVSELSIDQGQTVLNKDQRVAFSKLFKRVFTLLIVLFTVFSVAMWGIFRLYFSTSGMKKLVIDDAYTISYKSSGSSYIRVLYVNVINHSGTDIYVDFEYMMVDGRWVTTMYRSQTCHPNIPQEVSVDLVDMSTPFEWMDDWPELPAADESLYRHKGIEGFIIITDDNGNEIGRHFFRLQP